VSWLDAERANLVALIVHLAQHGHHAEAWHLANRFNGYFVLRKNTLDWQTVAEAAHTAASADGDPIARASTELHLGMASDALGRNDAAAAHYARSAELAEQAGWTECQAVALNNLARYSWLGARIDETIDCLTSALALHRKSGRKAGEAVTLANLATAHLEKAREYEHDQDRDQHHDHSHNLDHDDRHASGCACAERSRAGARRLFGEALDLHRDIGDRRNEGDTLRLLAEASRDSGDHLRALSQAEQAVQLVRGHGDLRFEVYALSTLATVRARLGRGESALDGHAEAVRLARELGDPRIQAQILLELSETHARLGRPDDAQIPLRDALALARQIGSWLLERQARRVERLVLAAKPAPRLPLARRPGLLRSADLDRV
jgi:tetratricopeptide (TPR) repeat protein